MSRRFRFYFCENKDTFSFVWQSFLLKKDRGLRYSCRGTCSLNCRTSEYPCCHCCHGWRIPTTLLREFAVPFSQSSVTVRVMSSRSHRHFTYVLLQKWPSKCLSKKDTSTECSWKSFPLSVLFNLLLCPDVILRLPRIRMSSLSYSSRGSLVIHLDTISWSEITRLGFQSWWEGWLVKNFVSRKNTLNVCRQELNI